MSILAPISFAFRTFNTAANVYLAGQVGWWMYKKVRELQKEKLKASELKARFVEEYKSEHNGEKPSDELVSLALRSYNAIERPWRTELKRIAGLKK
jgi:hypothetical protein